MSETIRREILLPQRREQVWQALTETELLAAWMYPNDFEPRVGHLFTFQVPPNPAVDFAGLTVQCEVLVCDPPRRLVFSWTVGGPVVDTRVSFDLEDEGEETRLIFQHSGFDLTQPRGKQAFKGAQFGWGKMLQQLASVTRDRAAEPREDRPDSKIL